VKQVLAHLLEVKFLEPRHRHSAELARGGGGGGGAERREAEAGEHAHRVQCVVRCQADVLGRRTAQLPDTAWQTTDPVPSSC